MVNARNQGFTSSTIILRLDRLRTFFCLPSSFILVFVVGREESNGSDLDSTRFIIPFSSFVQLSSCISVNRSSVCGIDATGGRIKVSPGEGITRREEVEFVLSHGIVGGV